MSTRYFSPEHFAIVEGRGSSQVYRFGEQSVNHHFCSRCGIYTFHDTSESPGHFRVNLGCVDGIDPLSLPIALIDGRSF